MSSSTTTTEASVNPPSGGNNGERPPADKAVNEIFLDKKCGRFGTHRQFFESCISPTANEIKDIQCEGLGGSTGACDMEIRFIFGEQAPQDNISTSTTVKPQEPADSRIPTAFFYSYKCGFGPGKGTYWNDTVPVPREQMQEVMEFCKQEIYGPPAALPLWLILLIIFFVITAVSVSAFLFWRYWLRKKLYAKEPRDNSSTFGSAYTSAPFSSNSSGLPSNGGRTTAKKMGRASTPVVSTAANRSSNQGPFKLSGSADSARGRAPSVRSAIQRSLSGRTGRPLAPN